MPESPRFLPRSDRRPRLVAAMQGAVMLWAMVAQLQAQSVASPVPASAGPFPPRFAVDQWTTEQGLPSNTIPELIQSADGYLWMIAQGTVVRFDGTRFVTFPGNGEESDASTMRAFSLTAGAGDTVWALAWEADRIGVVRYAGGRAQTVANLLGRAWEIIRDAKGALWLGGSWGLLARLDGDRLVDSLAVTLNTAAGEYGSENGPPMKLDRSGDLWLLDTERDSIGRIGPDGLRFVAPSSSPVLVTRPSTHDVLFESDRGDSVEVVDRDGTVLARFRRRRGSIARIVDRRGRLWVSVGARIEVYGTTGLTPLAVIDLPLAARITALVEDQEGNVWARTNTEGLFRIRELPTHVLGTADGILDNQVLMVAPRRDGSMLAVDRGGSLYGIAAGRIDLLHSPPEAHPGYFGGGGAVSWATEDRSGGLWLSWFDDVRSPQFALVNRRPGRPDIELPLEEGFRVIAEDPRGDGTIWLGSSAFVYRVQPSGSSYVVRDTFRVRDALRSLAFDSTGALWIAADSALVRIQGSTVEQFGGAPYPPLSARSVLVDPDGTLWIGTAGDGLLRFRDGVFQAVTEADGLAEDMVSRILDDGRGNLWMAGNRFIHRVGRADVDAFLSGRSDRVRGVGYGRGAGIPNPETSGWQAARDADGLLWFPTFDGIVVIDPALAIELDRSAPIVHIEEVRPADGGLHLPGQGVSPDGSVRLRPGERRFDVVYTAISLRDPDGLRFRYRLDGVDADWVEAGSARAATYTNVGAGNYTFRVQAVSGGGVESEVASMNLVVEPLFHETTWFLALLGIALLGAIALVIRYRERALVAAQVRLNHLVDERTSALVEEGKRTEAALKTVAAQAERLRVLDRARSRFFANVSHEFRTPLTLILGPLRDLRRGQLGQLPQAAEREVEVVIESGERLNALVEQLLDIARLEAGELRLAARLSDIVLFLRRIGRAFEPLSRAHGIAFEMVLPDQALLLVFDSDRLEKVMNNLLGNAFKFTDRGGRVVLRGALEADQGSPQFVIRVEDDGIGIPEEALSKVFDRFYQVDDSPRRRHQGTGLGLALARDLVQLHGGTIDVESSLGLGSSLTVRLPLPADSPLRPAADDDLASPVDDQAAVTDSHRIGSVVDTPEAGAEDVPTVLVVEDNARLRAYLRRHLDAHYRVVEAENGRVGLERAREVVPDLIISDILMPVMDGQTMVEEIRADPEIDFIPVILLTARTSHNSVLEGLQGGAEEYLTKPFDIDEVLLRVRNIIAGRHKLRERLRADQSFLPSPPAPVGKSDDSAAFALRVHEILAEHVDDEDFGIDQLARALFLSRSSLYRRTGEVFGSSPMQVILAFRLDQAAQWLRETELPVQEIAYGVGFKGVPHFTRRFRERFNTTPSGYRRG